MEQILERLNQIKENIARAQRNSNEKITLIAVSKFVPVEKMSIVYQAGLKDFGENYPQHLSEKWEQFPQVNWHMIGQMQTNKVKYLIGRITLLQSLDRSVLAKEVEKRAASREMVQRVLVQVNIGREPQKAGIVPEDLDLFLEELLLYPHIKVCGLMAIPPAEQLSSSYFEAMRALFDRYRAQDNRMVMDTLSMGMSHDYEQAIALGANMVRIGTALFGERKMNV